MKKKGRPSSYETKYCQMLIDHMAQGFSFETFAALINKHPDTVNEWARHGGKHEHPEFSDAKKVAFTHNRLFWERIGQDGMRGKIRNFNATVWIFNMKNRFKWHDNVVIDATTRDESKSKVSEIADKLTAAITASLEVK
jgi:hypothetical protein